MSKPRDYMRAMLSVGTAAFLAVAITMAAGFAARAQTLAEPSVALPGNRSLEAASLRAVAHADPSLTLRMQVALTLRNRAGLDQLLHDQQNPASPQYHQWLTPQQFNARFGPSAGDADAVSQWLGSQGLQVTETSLEDRYIRFTGTVADAERVFGARIMLFADGTAYSNIADPLIPARFSGVIGTVRGLDNFLHAIALSHHLPPTPEPASRWSGSPPSLFDYGPLPQSPVQGQERSVPTVTINGMTGFGTDDFFSYYHQTPLFLANINGAGGDCLAVVGDSDFRASAVALFNTQFVLPTSDITTVLVDGTSPGITTDETEALLDLEWSHAVAPASTRFYLGNPLAGTPNGPIVDAIQRAVDDNACGTISISFGLCGAPPSFYTGIVSPIYAQAAAQGQSIFIASGDFGAAGAVADPVTKTCVPASSRNINELGGDPNVTEVGGTSIFVSESAWNAVYETFPNFPQQLATGGGASAIYAKPAYQVGAGVPSDGARDVPDVAMIAALSDPSSGPGVFIGADNSGFPVMQCCFVGTSLSAQVWAGISKLVAEIMGTRPGPLNPLLYAQANADYGASGFRDVTMGNNNFGSVTGFSAGPFYDQTTGWGSVDIGNFGIEIAPTPVISSVPSPILVGASFTITGSSFSKGPKINLFVSTAFSKDNLNAGPLTPSFISRTKLIVPLPATVPLGQGFGGVQVINSDLGFKASNTVSVLLQGSAAAGIPTILSLNGARLAPTSSDPSFGVNNVETVLMQGTSIAVGGRGFDTAGVAVNVFCICPHGNAGPVFVRPGSGLAADSFRFTLPAGTTTGPASLVVVNKGADGRYSKSSNAVSVPVGARITVTSVTQSGSTITVNGTGFSTATIINLFNQQGGSVVNLGGFGPGGFPSIPLTIVNSTQFTFTRPAGSVAGPAYVQALNPPFLPFTSSGSGSAGAFTLL